MSDVVLVLAVAAIVASLERISPEGARVCAGRAVTRRAMGWLGLSLAVLSLMGSSAVAVVRWLDRSTPLSVPGPFVVRTIVALAVADLVAYWMHRAMHATPLLWRVHRIHHADPFVRWWTTYRFHPADLVLSLVVPYAAAAAAGAGRDAVGGAAVVVSVITWFAHADVFVPGRGRTNLVVLPASHRTHHELATTQSNFALVFPCWDHLFGTHAPWNGAVRHFGTPAPWNGPAPHVGTVLPSTAAPAHASTSPAPEPTSPAPTPTSPAPEVVRFRPVGGDGS